MTTNRRLPADRDRAVARLRRVTIGAAAGGIAGTMLFGGLAAVTYDGTTSTSQALALTDDSAAQVAADDSRTSGALSSSASTSDDQLQATPAPTTSSAATGSAHASTGGS
jgi:hypothetical protein